MIELPVCVSRKLVRKFNSLLIQVPLLDVTEAARATSSVQSGKFLPAKVRVLLACLRHPLMALYDHPSAVAGITRSILFCEPLTMISFVRIEWL